MENFGRTFHEEKLQPDTISASWIHQEKQKTGSV